MIVPAKLSYKLFDERYFIDNEVSCNGEVRLGLSACISSFSHNHRCSLTTFDSSFIGSFSGGTAVYFKNIGIGCYSSFAEGVKVVPKTDVQGLTASSCRYQGVSPIFANFKGQTVAHDFPRTLIGHDVWMGGNSQIQAGTIVGHGAIIGAGSVVTKHVPPYGVVVGNPARLLRLRFAPAMIDRILKSQWYTYNWEDYELSWGQLETCLGEMEQYLAKTNVPKNEKICILRPSNFMFMDKVPAEQTPQSWTFEDEMEQLYGTRDIVELFARPEIKANTYH